MPDGPASSSLLDWLLASSTNGTEFWSTLCHNVLCWGCKGVVTFIQKVLISMIFGLHTAGFILCNPKVVKEWIAGRVIFGVWVGWGSRNLWFLQRPDGGLFSHPIPAERLWAQRAWNLASCPGGFCMQICCLAIAVPQLSAAGCCFAEEVAEDKDA